MERENHLIPILTYIHSSAHAKLSSLSQFPAISTPLIIPFTRFSFVLSEVNFWGQIICLYFLQRQRNTISLGTSFNTFVRLKETIVRSDGNVDLLYIRFLTFSSDLSKFCLRVCAFSCTFSLSIFRFFGGIRTGLGWERSGYRPAQLAFGGKWPDGSDY
jgi:hypothetical protein